MDRVQTCLNQPDRNLPNCALTQWLAHGLALWLVLWLAFSTSHAAEVDSFTGYPHRLADASEILNQETQRRLQLAIDQANQLTGAYQRHPRTDRPLFPQVLGISYCSQAVLVATLESQMADALLGQLEKFAQTAPQIERFSVPYEASVYRDFTRDETVTLARSAHLAALISVNGIVIGTDKLGHFMTEGLAYYQRLSEPGAQWSDAVLLGKFMESTYFGAVTTGVYSFADLAANAQGARFWVRLLNHVKLGGLAAGEGPRIVCKNRRWTLLGQFDWRDYVDPAWDEAVNCSMLRNAKLLEKFRAALGTQHCPRQPLPEDLSKRYGPFARYVLNTDGLRILPDDLEPDAVMEAYLLAEHPESRWRRWVVDTLSDYYQAWETPQQSDQSSEH